MFIIKYLKTNSYHSNAPRYQVLLRHLAPKIPNVGHVASRQDSNKASLKKTPPKQNKKQNQQQT